MLRLVLIAGTIAALAAAATSLAHVVARPGDAAPPSASAIQQDLSTPYDGRFTFTRVRYTSGFSGSGWRRGGRGGAWAHDYPAADRNMQRLLAELTSTKPRTDRSNVLDLEDPAIFRFPILYMSEPGYWRITEEGADNLRRHLLKGGLLILDDFEGRQWDNFDRQLRRALPDHRWIELDASHPVFNAFFRIRDIYVPHPYVRVQPAYYALFEDDDPNGRMLVLANHNSDLAEYWEYSGTGFLPVDESTEAWKLGISYILYGLTH